MNSYHGRNPHATPEGTPICKPTRGPEVYTHQGEQIYRGTPVDNQPTPTSPPQVASSVEGLEHRVAHLADRIDLLESRLDVVLRPREQNECGGPSCLDISVPLSARINGSARRIGEMIDRVESILARLEL